jgi:hypothetical protein
VWKVRIKDRIAYRSPAIKTNSKLCLWFCFYEQLWLFASSNG